MTKVYMVTDGWYSDYRVLGIYSTKARAEKAKEIYAAGNEVDEIEMDVTPEHPRGCLAWVVEMNRNGDADRVERENCDGHRVTCYIYIPWRGESTSMRAYLWAKDADHAVKVANEWRTRIIANNLWINGRHYEPGKDF